MKKLPFKKIRNQNFSRRVLQHEKTSVQKNKKPKFFKEGFTT